MYAVIVSGGKQYKVTEGEVLKLEKLNSEVGAKIELDTIMVSDEQGVKLGEQVKGYKVVAEVIAQDKMRKVVVYKYKSKKNERKKQGHRQPFTAVKIESISAK